MRLGVGVRFRVGVGVRNRGAPWHLLLGLAHGHALGAGAVARLDDGHEGARDVQHVALG